MCSGSKFVFLGTDDGIPLATLRFYTMRGTLQWRHNERDGVSNH